MTAIVDAAPFPWSDPRAEQLRRALLALYPQPRGELFIARSVGLKLDGIPHGGPLWRTILDRGAEQGLNRKLVELVRDQNPKSPQRPFLDALLADEPVALDPQPQPPDGSSPFISGTDAVTVPEALLFADDLSLPVGTVAMLVQILTRMLALSPSVCLLHVTSDGHSVEGTAFRIGDDLLLTNQHVLVPYGEKAIQVTAEFGFETDAAGNGLPSRSIACKAAGAIVDAEGDWGVIRAADPLDAAWPIVRLADAADPVAGEAAYILQHPLGGRKRLGFLRNRVMDFDDRVVHYLTDTQSGSSGSPVFNAAGHLIALHHAGGVPQDVAGRAPMKKNEGIRIPRILKALVAAGLLPG
jgi:hypothetical protein